MAGEEEAIHPADMVEVGLMGQGEVGMQEVFLWALLRLVLVLVLVLVLGWRQAKCEIEGKTGRHRGTGITMAILPNLVQVSLTTRAPDLQDMEEALPLLVTVGGLRQGRPPHQELMGEDLLQDLRLRLVVTADDLHRVLHPLPVVIAGGLLLVCQQLQEDTAGDRHQGHLQHLEATISRSKKQTRNKLHSHSGASLHLHHCQCQ